jgi:hypothetical protein
MKTIIIFYFLMFGLKTFFTSVQSKPFIRSKVKIESENELSKLNSEFEKVLTPEVKIQCNGTPKNVSNQSSRLEVLLRTFMTVKSESS